MRLVLSTEQEQMLSTRKGPIGIWGDLRSTSKQGKIGTIGYQSIPASD